LKDMVKEVCRRRNIEVSIDWGYWLANIVYAEKRGDSYVLITKDGLVLEVNSLKRGLAELVEVVYEKPFAHVQPAGEPPRDRFT
ncbi:MAG: hypothetical protein QW607_08155, partial [Desulfurococcaceae archaeon]